MAETQDNHILVFIVHVSKQEDDDDGKNTNSAVQEKKKKEEEKDKKEEEGDDDQEMEEEKEKDFQLADEFKPDVKRQDIIDAQDRPREEDSDLFSHIRQEELQQEEPLQEALDELKDITKEFKQNLDVNKKDEEEENEEDEKKDKENKQGNAAEQKPALKQEASKRCEELAPIGQDWVTRGDESIFNAIPKEEDNDDEDEEMEVVDQADLVPVGGPVDKELVEQWLRLCASTADMAHYLTEQLRMIIEPTKASRLKGDYR